MKLFDAEAVRKGLGWPDLIAALKAMFAAGCETPPRPHYTVPGGTLLLMPAWSAGGHIGVKIVNVFPGNADKGLPAVSSAYMLSDGATGAMIAQIDGGELTSRRTAAASVLAATFLARPASTVLTVFGTGRVATNLIDAYCATFPIAQVRIVGRDAARTRAFAADHARPEVAFTAFTDAAEAVSGADIVAAATLSTRPLIPGAALSPGAHVDLVGGFRPDMREADDAVFARAALVAVDTREGALAEAGDIIQPLASGALSEAKIAADLFDLCRGTRPGRTDPAAITVFKSVGASLEDLAAASLLARSAGL
ncbi:ornithine cyclodeaminase family protein [Pseudoxanthobacter sp.]|uniref:ornithine cyclodeaminase family protein n=1 Tax=Pseudoxanthobacter sp. TaxID=1925742 RepID=UPI002FE13229